MQVTCGVGAMLCAAFLGHIFVHHYVCQYQVRLGRNRAASGGTSTSLRPTAVEILKLSPLRYFAVLSSLFVLWMGEDPWLGWACAY